MTEPTVTQRLAAILAADVAGYSRLMQDDERATVATLDDCRLVFREHVGANQGRVVDTAGDSVLAVFDTAIGAAQAAVDIQKVLAERNAALPEGRQMLFRIGIHLGDIIEKPDGTIYGDGVNIAARLEGLADPGGIAVSGMVHDGVGRRLDAGFEFLGEHQVKNIVEPVRAYRVAAGKSSKSGRSRTRAFPISVYGAATAVVVFSIGLVIWAVSDHSRPVGSPSEIARTPTGIDDPILAVPSGPSIAVLPFENRGGDPDQDYFSDGLTELLITELTRFPELFVIARNTTYQYKGQAVDVRAVGSDLGIQYVLQGSVSRAGSTVRVNALLSDTAGGEQIWAETYDKNLTAENMFLVQDEITQQVVAALAASGYGALARAQLAGARTKPISSLDSYECILRAHEYHRVESAPEHLDARSCLEKTVETEPDNVEAWALLARSYIDEHRYQYNVREDAKPPIDRALDAARRAVELDPESQHAHWALSKTYFFRHEVDKFISGAERAFSLNPNNATILADLGLQMGFAGEWERAVALVDKAKALNPRYPGWYHFLYVWYHSINGRHAKALDAAQKIEMPGFYWSHIALALGYGGTGRKAEATVAIKDIWKLYPDFNIRELRKNFRIFNFRDDDIAAMAKVLREAGLPD